VTEGTVMEATKIPLQKWLLGFYIMGASKKGVSAHQLHRTLGITYKSAWFMAHRVRHAMEQEPLKSRLSGTVEMDQTYVGGKMHNSHHGRRQPIKYPVVSLVQRDGGARSYHVASVNATNLREAIRKSVTPGSTIYADTAGAHVSLRKEKTIHGMVDHTADEYVRGDVHTNTVEGFFSLLKRGIFGVYHHVSPQHLQRYLTEFDFRYSLRKSSDSSRAINAICLTQGKRLKYRELPAHDESKIKGGRFWHNQFRPAPQPNPQLEPPFGPPTGGDHA
jgi:transposase-like protein